MTKKSARQKDRKRMRINKRLAILIIVAFEAITYLLLLVGIPVFEDMVNIGSRHDSNVTDNWTAAFPSLTVEPEPRELYKVPVISYFIPGLIGAATVVLILKQKKETK